MINNFEQIKNLLHFENEDIFYHLQILKRKKENPEIGRNAYLIKTYYITSIEYLDKVKDEIINLCDFNNSRAYINLNPRSFEKTAFNTLKKISDIIMNKDYKSVRKAYDSVCGDIGIGKDKKWIIDIDDSNEVSPLMLAFIEHKCNPPGDKYITSIPTKNGIHIITKPFDKSTFSKEYPNIDIQTNNPTILYSI